MRDKLKGANKIARVANRVEANERLNTASTFLIIRRLILELTEASPGSNIQVRAMARRTSLRTF